MKHVGKWEIVAVATVLLCAGCASIVSKSIYPVTINSYPDGADIVVKDENGIGVFSGKTPTTVTLQAGAGFFQGKDYSVTFSKAGYASQTVPVRRGIDAWYIAGNLFFGGLIGYLIVDPATGAMWTLQQNVTVSLTGQSSSLDGQEPTIQIVTIDQVPDHLRSHLVRIR